MRTSAWRRRNSFWSRSRLIGSTAPKGSSISITPGLAASARATPTRCCWPPESWAGKRSRELGVEPDQLEQLARPARRSRSLVPAEQPRHGGDVVGDRPVREEADLLDHVADLAPQLGRRALAHRAVADEDVALGDLDHAVDHPHRGRLAASRGPDEDADLARRHLEVELVDGRRVGARVALRHPPEGDRGGLGGPGQAVGWPRGHRSRRS